MPAGGGSDKILSAAVATGIDTRPGVTSATDSPLDVVPQPDTFLAVQTASGARAYTRNGHIEVGGEGQLTVGGNALLDDQGQPLQVPEGSSPTITERGEVFADNAVVGRLGLFRIAGGLDRIGPTLMGPAAGAQVTAVEDDDVQVRVGELELGNAPALEATIQMISAQRHFDSAMQAIQTYRRLDEKAVEVGKIR
jgi:flagellar basal-body rod protein FlgF